MAVRVDVTAGLAALALHLGVAFGLSHVPPPPPHTSSIVEMEVRRTPPPPPPITPPEPPKPEPPPPPPPKVVPIKRAQPVAPPPVAPPPNATPPKEPPKQEVKPVFGVTMESTTTGDSSFAVPVGNTTMIDPGKSAKGTGPVQPLAAAPAPAKPAYQPVSDVFIKSLPGVDTEECGRGAEYTDEAKQLGIEGAVLLRIALDEKGKVYTVKVMKGLGHGLDDAAVQAIKHRCRFTPAMSNEGKPVAYVIQSYIFNFELPR